MNYPEGVTGNEYEIAGPDAEYTDTREDYCRNEECSFFETVREVEIDVSEFAGRVWGEWKCATCGHQNDFEGESYR